MFVGVWMRWDVAWLDEWVVVWMCVCLCEWSELCRGVCVYVPHVGEKEEGGGSDGHLQPPPVPDKDSEDPRHGFSKSERNFDDDADEGTPFGPDEFNSWKKMGIERMKEEERNESMVEGTLNTCDERKCHVEDAALTIRRNKIK